MKFSRFFYFFSLIFLLTCLTWYCKKKDSSDDNNPGIVTDDLKAFQIMQTVEDEFIRIGDSMDVTPKQALFYAIPYVEQMEDVAEVQFYDSTHLNIITNEGNISTIGVTEIAEEGLDITRGGPGGTDKLVAFDGSCKNKIDNKKVMLYAAYHHEFYNEGEYDTRIVDKIEKGEVDLETVVVLKDEQCTIEQARHFDLYGLVILDTHGLFDGFLTGLVIQITPQEVPESVDAFHQLLAGKTGEPSIGEMITAKQVRMGTWYKYDPTLQNQEVWDKFKKKVAREYKVIMTSKGIRELMPDLSNTVVFANCCYSGFQASNYLPKNSNHGLTFDPVQPSWMSKNPIAYFGYEAANKKVSYQAPNSFCKQNEDTLIQSLFYDGDSTGLAHLFGGTTLNNVPWNRRLWRWDEGPLYFKQYGKESWCFGICGKSFIDARDGQEYQTICLGDQVWMAENLNWAGAGRCYNDMESSCDVNGRLYSIAEILNGANTTDSVPSGIRGICPEGWHVPSHGEYKIMELYLGASESDYANITDTMPSPLGRDVALGARLRSPDGWYSSFSDDPDKINETGFTGLPAGIYVGANDKFYNSGLTGFFSTTSSMFSTQGTRDVVRYLGNSNDPQNKASVWSVLLPAVEDNIAYSLRCIKDPE